MSTILMLGLGFVSLVILNVLARLSMRWVNRTFGDDCGAQAANKQRCLRAAAPLAILVVICFWIFSPSPGRAFVYGVLFGLMWSGLARLSARWASRRIVCDEQSRRSARRWGKVAIGVTAVALVFLCSRTPVASDPLVLVVLLAFFVAVAGNQTHVPMLVNLAVYYAAAVPIALMLLLPHYPGLIGLWMPGLFSGALLGGWCGSAVTDLLVSLHSRR